jgi:hypothetical protein
MRAGTILLGLAMLAGPALAAPCTEQLAALERQVTGAGSEAAAASSGGQGVAAAREGQALQPPPANRPAPPSGPFQDPQREAQATQRAADAGAGGDGVVQARARLNQAREQASRGDEAGCLATLEEARRQLSR